MGVASYAYLTVLEFLSEDGQKTLQGLLDSHADHERAENPVVSPYYNLAKSLLESEDEASGAFLVGAGQAILPVDPDSKDSPAGPVAAKYITFGTMLSQPFSVHIESFDPNKEPAIDPKYLTNPLDVGESRAHTHRRARGPCVVIDCLNATPKAAKPSHPTGQVVSPR